LSRGCQTPKPDANVTDAPNLLIPALAPNQFGEPAFVGSKRTAGFTLPNQFGTAINGATRRSCPTGSLARFHLASRLEFRKLSICSLVGNHLLRRLRFGGCRITGTSAEALSSSLSAILVLGTSIPASIAALRSVESIPSTVIERINFISFSGDYGGADGADLWTAEKLIVVRSSTNDPLD
jgi:hypothetical protein